MLARRGLGYFVSFDNIGGGAFGSSAAVLDGSGEARVGETSCCVYNLSTGNGSVDEISVTTPVEE